jgi:hypothetical protein
VSTPPPTLSVRFAEAARRLGAVAHGAELRVPAFRSPPRVPGVDRTIRRFPGGTVVAVRIEGRAWDAIVADMVEGVLVTNRLDQAAAATMRGRLRAAVCGRTEDEEAAGDHRSGGAPMGHPVRAAA